MPTEPADAGEIEQSAERLLLKAGLDEQLPTPVEELVSAAELITENDYVLGDSLVASLPQRLQSHIRSALGKIRGVLDRREKTIYIPDSVDDENRRRFVTCHEIGHKILPWQQDLVLADTDLTLSPATQWQFEREANQCGAELLFQRSLLARVAGDYQVEIATVGILGALFGASFRATFRRYIETHETAAIAGLVLDPEPRADGCHKRKEVPCSQAWLERFGQLSFRTLIKASALPPPSFDIATADELADELVFKDVNGETVTVVRQMYWTRYCLYMFLWAPNRGGATGRRRKPALLAATA